MSEAKTLQNLADILPLQAARWGARPALRYKHRGTFADLTWQEYAACVESCAAALIDAGLAPGDRVGLLSENCPAWLIADLGILVAGGVTVPLHAGLADRQVQEQLVDAEVSILFVATAKQWIAVQAMRRSFPMLRHIIVFDAVIEKDDSSCWAHFLAKGSAARVGTAAERQLRRAGLHADSLATILYTSGTTGKPKGVMLTHGNLLSNAQAFLTALPIAPEAVRLNWLPFSHVFARTVDHYVSLLAGATLCLAESPATVLDDLAVLQPTHLTGVPRFYEKVLAQAAAPTRAETSRRLREIFGPRIVWLKTGGAPLPAAVFEAYQHAGLELLQGYGLTETSPDIATNRPGQNKVGTVGLPLPGIDVRLAADGEILTHGPHVMKGYWHNPTATVEVLRDGWLHTGDLGRLDEEGFLIITGRKKDMIVLSTGIKVMPAPIENLLVADPVIEQAVLYGEGRPFLTALIVPNWAQLRQAVSDNGLSIANKTAEELVHDPDLHSWLAGRMALALAEASPWEQVRKFVLLPGPFSIAAEELTVSLKLRRQVIWEKQRSVLARLYED